ncbi:MAG TPA: hypothetical protein VF462_13170 [Micromonosporaceae bacterium]
MIGTQFRRGIARTPLTPVAAFAQRFRQVARRDGDPGQVTGRDIDFPGDGIGVAR